MLNAIETPDNLLGQAFKRGRDLCEQLWFSHDEGEGMSRTKRGRDGETEEAGEVEVFQDKECVLRNLWEWIIIKRVSSPGMLDSDQVDAFGTPGGRSVKGGRTEKRSAVHMVQKHYICASKCQQFYLLEKMIAKTDTLQMLACSATNLINSYFSKLFFISVRKKIY